MNPLLMFLLMNPVYPSLTSIKTFHLFHDLDEEESNLEKFWTSTGLSPPQGEAEQYLLSRAMEQNFALIGAMPSKGISHIRIHWLLDLIAERSGIEDHNFTALDAILHRLKDNGLSPGFELMGGRRCPTTLAWTEFLETLLKRYKEMFGPNYLKSWRFETLNEPDLKQYNLWNFTLTDYIEYFQASALTLAKYGLQLWGPAGLFKNEKYHPLCWGILEVCNRTTCPISVLSFHKKGGAKASQVLERTEEFLDTIKTTYPGMKSIPIANDEADPLTGWWKSANWRSDVRYAAAVVQTVIGYIDMAKRTGTNLAAISNDNGFLSNSPNFWTQRTLFARMQINNFNPMDVELIKKPIYSAMVLLSFMENTLHSLRYKPGEPGFCALITSEGTRRAIILSISHDTLNITKPIHRKARIHINVIIPISNVMRKGVIYLLDNVNTNPAKLWRKAGSPIYPDKAQRRILRQKAEPLLIKTVDIAPHKSRLELTLILRVPSVVLINICPCDGKPPGAVSGLRYLIIKQDEIVLLWNDSQVNSKCLLTYIVEFKPKSSTDYMNISDYYFFTTSFYFDGCVNFRAGGLQCQEELLGEYRITAVDQCNKQGPSTTLVVH